MSAQADFTERRRDPRYEFHQKVYLQDDDSLLGYAQNLNLGGMLLVTREPTMLLEQHDLWFGADKEAKKQNRIFVSAYPVWQKTNSDHSLHYSGMRFSYLDAHTVDKLQKLFEFL